MMSNKYKGILIFSILYTVLFVFDGDKLLASVMPLPLRIIYNIYSM